MKKHLIALSFAAISLSLPSCDKDNTTDNNRNKDYSTCLGPSHVTNDGAVTYTYLLDEHAPEFKDTLAKYPNLQASSVNMKDGFLNMECNVWANASTQLFFATYGLKKNLSNGAITATQSNLTQYDLANVNLTGSVRYESAYDSASKYFIYDQMCIKYTFGVYDKATLLNVDSPVYRVAWKFEGKKTGNIVYVDANDNTVIEKHLPVTVD